MNFTDIVLILFVIVVFFGLEDLPQIARWLGKVFRLFYSIKDEISAGLFNAIDLQGYDFKDENTKKNASDIPSDEKNDDGKEIERG